MLGRDPCAAVSHFVGFAILECRSCRALVAISNTHRGSNCGSNKGPIRISAGFRPLFSAVLCITKLLKDCQSYNSHGGSRRFESCCAHHKINNLR
jgi:hypothetical protein